MNNNYEKNSKNGIKKLAEYAEKHKFFILGECQMCRVITNTKHGRKETICNVLRAYKLVKEGHPVFGYIVGLDEIEFKPDKCKKYRYIKI